MNEATPRRARRATLGLLGLVLLAGCGEDAVADPDLGMQPDAGTGDPAYLVVQRIRTPDSRTVFLSVLPDLAARDLDTASSLEVSGTSRATAFGGKVFVFDGESGIVTRYAVSDAGALVEESPSLSFATFGIVRFRTTFAFVSPTRAYYLDLVGGQMIVWDPEAMAILESIPVPETQRGEFNVVGGAIVQVGSELVAPISWDNLVTREIVPSINALVFSADTGQLLRVDESAACVVAASVFADGDDGYYLIGDSASGSFDIFGDEELPPPCAVRGQEGMGLDERTAVDLRALTGAPHISDAVGLGGGRFVTQAYDSEVDPDTLTDPFSYFDLEIWRFAVVDLDAETSEILDALPLSGIAFDPSIVDGEALLPVVDEGAGQTTLYRLTDAVPVESITATGDIQRVVRVR